MKTKNVLLKLALAIFALVSAAPAAHAQDYYGWVLSNLLRGNSVARYNSAVSTDVPLLVKYVGTALPGGTVTVAANGDITLSTGGVGASAVDTTLECPVSGALGGVIDVSDAACDTLGEVVDVMNASPNWRAVILDGLRTDSSNDTLLARTEINAAVSEGLGLFHDAGVGFKSTIALTTVGGAGLGVNGQRSIQAYIDNPINNTMVKGAGPFTNLATLLFKAIGTTTYGSGTSTFEVFSVIPTYRTAGSTNGSEIVTQLWSEAGGGSTTAKTFDFGGYGLRSQTGAKLVVRINNSAAMTAATFPAYAVQFDPVKPK